MKGLIRSSVSPFVAALVFAPAAWALDEGSSSFLKEAAQGGLAEVELAEVAQERAARKEVKDLAKKIEDHHKKANDQLKSLAENKDVELPDEPAKQHKQTKEQLEKLKGAQFDQAYLQTMVQEHQKDIRKFEQQAKSAKDPEVKQFASQTLPTLKEHLKQAQALQKPSSSK
ncbi:membrane protein [Sulfurifustis variabilis]|uniref:Membrane protein n=1 Tax=Sulfurifustis variabilis TaxID=1675686 RepID=A0A1B4V2E8_9GAMM|nr:DUF4142 domain-containing protein [Sulfurifustis variabilis]BAU47495.1 membrane protein [Sulfurifustis variabilis]